MHFKSALVSTLAIPATFAVLSLASPKSAHAQTVIGVDLEGATPVGASPDGLRSGPAFNVRVGYKIGIPLLALTPEIGYGYTRLSGHDGFPSFDMNRLFLGARLAFGAVLVPSIYAHLGYAFVATGGDSSTTGVDSNYNSDPYVEGGFALDLRIIPHVGVGLHVAYSEIASSPSSIDWVNYGAQADVTF